MGKRRSYNYNDARYSSHGVMVCCICGKAITEGRYRTHETPKAYVNAHEACCPDDPKWAELDANIAAGEARHREFVAACIEFKLKWDVDDLDDWIPDDQLRALSATPAKGESQNG